MQGSLPAGWLAFTGRELNPLDRDEGFQITSSSLPGLFLAQRPKTCTIADIRLLTRSVGRSQLLVKGLGSFDAIWERARPQLNLSHDGIVDT
jgi:hypothetical protein